MASAEKKLTTPDAATLALWRVAENGNVDELVDLLPRVPDIDVCNEHGMTALMRAAQNGRVKMVRALLEHGADANIKRNDRFTALALAAFFGHTEVVRTLMQHGADLKASTRGGTSPQMWASARTFAEVANQLETPQAPRPAPPVKRAEVIAETPAAPEIRKEPLVVRTLKDPPEIWDLVHEAPRSFDARSAFLARLQSMKRSFAFRAATAVVVIAMCVVGVLVLRGVQARSERTTEPPIVETLKPKNIEQPVAPVTPVVAAIETGAATEKTAAPEATAAPQAEAVAPSLTENSKPSVVTRKYNFGTRVMSSHRGTTQVAAIETAQPDAAPVEKPQPPRIEASPKPKVIVPLSPQLITPAKTSTSKAKVIQWP